MSSARTLPKTTAIRRYWLDFVFVAAAGIFVYFLSQVWSVVISVRLTVLLLGVALCAGATPLVWRYRRSHRTLAMMAELTGLTKVEEELQKGATPAVCMQRANTSLSFMGIGGRKWSPN